MQTCLVFISLFISMSNYDLLSKWRKALAEQKETTPVTIPLKPDTKPETSVYKDFISSIEKSAGLDPKEQEKKAKEQEKEDPNCKIKTACNCLDRSETSLEVSEIQEILNKYFASTGESIKLDVSGECDLETQKAIMRFQKNTGIECDGCVGDETHGKMLDLKLTEKPITTYVPAPTSDTDVGDESIDDVVLYSATAGGTEGTISIKSNDPSRPYGFKKEIPAGLYNGVDFSRELNAKDLKPRGRTKYCWGNPVLLKAIKDAADAVTKNFPEQSGKGIATLWSVSGKTGGPKIANYRTGRYHNSHQTGLDCDIGFYQNTNKPIPGTLNTYTKKQRQNFIDSKKDLQSLGISRLFDMPRNITFLDHLIRNPAIKLVFIDQPIIGAMRRWLEENDNEGKFSTLYSELKKRRGKVYEPGMMGHHNHYHVRAEFPPGSPTMREFKKMRLAARKSGVKNVPITTEDLNKYSFYFGTVDGQLIDSHNANAEFYGASIQKPIAALAQLIQYKNDPARKLNDKEIGMLLSYSKSSEGSNRVNRRISPGNRSKSYERGEGATEVGKIDPAILRQILRVFDISNQKFTYGRSNNKQSALDYYKFLSGLERMTTGKPRNKAEEEFAEKYEPEMKQVIGALKKRRYAAHIKNGFRSAGITNFWGKGGRASGSLNYGIVIDGKYVLVIYTRFSEERYGTPGFNKTGAGGTHTAKMFTIIKKLVDKIK